MNANIGKMRPVHILTAISVLIIIGNIAFSAFFIAGQEEKIASLEDRAALLKAAVSGRGDSSWVKKARMVEFMSGVPTQNELAAVLRQVFDAARDNNLKVPEGDYSAEPAKDGRLSKYTFTLPVEGKYSDVKRFIYELETSDMPIAIDELTLTKGKEESRQLSLNIRISVLYR